MVGKVWRLKNVRPLVTLHPWFGNREQRTLCCVSFLIQSKPETMEHATYVRLDPPTSMNLV